ncbi:MAG: DUF3667 domain-containing protein [Ferruginibacter sp.]
MSHLKERTEKNCLNCNAQVYGKYCHVCGQENTEPAETVWHLVTHFFNDITHFDGKFFSTLKLLLIKPGFLSAEYKKGRRASYLNPVRMYIFTSFIFFIIFFSTVHIGESVMPDLKKSNYVIEPVDKMDSAEFADMTRQISNGQVMTKDQFYKYVDSTNALDAITIFGKTYKSRQQYDSLVKAGAIHPGWLENKVATRLFEIREKFRKNDKGEMVNVMTIFLHMFPQILFVSLPLFAFLLWLIYLRRKDFYFVSHGIYSIHLYIFYFICLLFLIGIRKLLDILHWNGLAGWVTFLLVIGLLLYEYKAMRNFYQQGRAKTIVKFSLAVIWRSFIFFILALFFLLFSFYKL